MKDELAKVCTKARRRALAVAAVGGAGLVLAALLDLDRALQAWLLAYMGWLGFALGSLALFMLHVLTGGGWGRAIRRFLEAGMRTLPLFAVGIVPVLLGLPRLYEWSHADVVRADPVLASKAAFLNPTFFVVRSVAYVSIWMLLAGGLLRIAGRYERDLRPADLRRLRTVCGPGLVLYVLTVSFASMDWVMTLEPHWFSTIYGVIWIVGQALTVLALCIVLGAWLRRFSPISKWFDERAFHDLGNLSLAFVLLWAYVSFSQYLIIWSGNLPEEVPWYLRRTHSGWQAIAVALVVLHFAVPFPMLLSRRHKRRARTVAGIALLLLVGRWFDVYWLVAPAFEHAASGGPSPSWVDASAIACLGGAWFALLLARFDPAPLPTLGDVRERHRAAGAPAS